MTSQTRPQVMTLMTMIHMRAVIIDVDDTRIRNIEKGPDQTMRNFNGRIADGSI